MNRSEIAGPAPLVTPEMSPASLWCQRWTGRRHSWRHTSEGGFDPSRYVVEPIREADARAWVIQHHYSGSYPAASRRYGLLDRAGTLLGVCVLGIPMSRAVLSNVFPELEPSMHRHAYSSHSYRSLNDASVGRCLLVPVDALV